MPEPGDTHRPPARRGRIAGLQGLIVEYLGLIAVLGCLVAVFGLWDPSFLGRATCVAIANQIPATVIAAVGMTYVLIVAGIDLSVGSVLALSSAVLGMLMKERGLSVGLAAAGALATGLLCGGVNGLVTVRWRLPSFIVTLGMLEIARGGAHLVTGSRTQYIGSTVGVLANTSVLGLSLPFLAAIAAVLVGQLVLSRTVFGRYMVAVGTNEEAVRLSGVDPRAVKLAVFALSGILAAAAAVIDTSRLESADPNAGSGLELQVIAAVVVGGTSLLGGRGSVVRSFLGVLIIAVLGTGLASVGVRDETKRLVTGCVIVAAAVLDNYRRRAARSSTNGGP